jgi:hypothetical protein
LGNKLSFGAIYTFDNLNHLIEMVLDMYVLLHPSAKKLIIREKQALAYYIIYGYDKETVKDLETSLSKDISNGYVRTINNSLRKKGYLVKDKNNMQKNHLSEEMKQIKKEFVEKKGRMFPVGFVKK